VRQQQTNSSIHYTGADKPWNNFSRKFLSYARWYCADENSHPFPNDPQFVWYSMYSKMRRSYAYMIGNATDDVHFLNLNSFFVKSGR